MQAHIPEPWRTRREPELTYEQISRIDQQAQAGKGFKSTSCGICAPKDKSQLMHASEKRVIKKTNPFKSVFASNTERFNVNQGHGVDIGPGTYTLGSQFRKSDRESYRSSSAFMASGRRSPRRDPSGSPHYTHLQDAKEWTAKGAYISRLSRGSKGGNMFPDSNIIGQPDPRQQSKTRQMTTNGLADAVGKDAKTYPCFKSGQDRFPKQTITCTPPPDHYQRVQYRPKLKAQPTSSFSSTTPRRLPQLDVPEAHAGPPPGSYSPQAPPKEWSNRTYRINQSPRKTLFAEVIRDAKANPGIDPVIDGKKHLALAEQVKKSPRSYKVLASTSPRFSSPKREHLTQNVTGFAPPSEFTPPPDAASKSRAEASKGLGFGTSQARWSGVFAGEENPNKKTGQDGTDAEWLKLRRQREAEARQEKRERALKARGGLGDFKMKESQEEKYEKDLLTGEVFNLRKLDVIHDGDYDITDKFVKYYREVAYNTPKKPLYEGIEPAIHIDEFAMLPDLQEELFPST